MMKEAYIVAQALACESLFQHPAGAMRWMTIGFFIWTLAAAQQVGQNVPPGSAGTATFTTSSQLVVETVVVTDKKGAAVEGLTAKDFTVTEDGVPQAIRYFEYQKLPQTPAAAPAQAEHVRIYDKL